MEMKQQHLVGLWPIIVGGQDMFIILAIPLIHDTVTGLLQHGAQGGLDAAAALGLADGLHAALHPLGRLLLSCSLPRLLRLPLPSLSTLLTPALSCWGVLPSPTISSGGGLLT